MEIILYMILAFLTYYLIRIYILRENLTLDDLNKDNKNLHEKVDKLHNEYEVIHQKIDKQDKAMGKASDQVSSLHSSITSAIKSP